MPRERCGVRDQSDGEYRKHRSDSTLNADPRLIAAGRYRTIYRANYTKCAVLSFSIGANATIGQNRDFVSGGFTAAANWRGRGDPRGRANERGYATAADEGLAARTKAAGRGRCSRFCKTPARAPAAEAAAAGTETVTRRSRADPEGSAGAAAARRGGRRARGRPSLRGRRSRPQLCFAPISALIGAPELHRIPQPVFLIFPAARSSQKRC